MSAQRVLGSSEPVVTSISNERSDREAAVVKVEGLYNDLVSKDPETYCLAGMTVETSTCQSTGDGMGVLTVRCVKYNNGFSATSARTTFRVDMMEVTYDLEDHPYLKTCRKDILMWLATDESKRGGTGAYTYVDGNGNIQSLDDEKAQKFCDAYMAGIKTFNRYYPVIEKISIWKNPPGMSMSGNSFTGGSPSFSNNVGKFDSPPLSLQGYSSSHWFKSKDGWVQNADTTWTRNEQWTYTPENSSGDNAWIYNNLTMSNQ